MSEDFRKTFSSSVAGYNRAEVDQFVASLMAEARKLEQYSALAVREQNSLRDKIVELEESLKLAKSPGYAQVGAQFEQTLRLAESEAARLVNDAGRDAIKIREEAKADAEVTKIRAQDEVDEIIVEAEAKAKTLLVVARKEASEITEEAEQQLERATKDRMDLEKRVNVIKSEADSYAADVKAELQVEVEKIQNANSRLLKKNAELDSLIARKLDEGEKQALEIFRRVESEATALKQQAERELADSTAEASSLIENAEDTLLSSRKEADRIVNEANSVSLNLLADTRARAESLAIKSLDLTRDAIAEAEYRISKLPGQQIALEDFLLEIASLLTPEQQVLLSRRRSINKAAEPVIEAQVIAADETKGD